MNALGALGLLAAIGAAVLATSLAPTAFAATNWTVDIVPPNGPNTNAIIYGASARSDTDAWAVGSAFGSAGTTPPPIAYRWNGTAWSSVPTPRLAKTERFRGLNAVSASSSNDAWTVGFSIPAFGGYSARSSLYEHWNGTAWTVVAGANAGTLTGVADFSPTNAWAVSTGGVIEHWNGTTWTATTTPMPNPADSFGNTVTSMSADGPNDIWAVGTYTATPSYTAKAYALHYDGASWTVLQLAQTPVGTSGLTLSSASAISPTNVWAAGNSSNGTFVEHFDGRTWRLVPLPAHMFYPALTTITARSATDVWAFGSEFTDANARTNILLLLHWNGTTWSTSPSPTVTTNNNIYASATAPGAGHVWALGVKSGSQPLILSHP